MTQSRSRRRFAAVWGVEFGLVGLALALPLLARAEAPTPAPPPPAPSRLEIPRLETSGPFGSTLRLELSERVRGELVDFFDTDPAGATRNHRYSFFGNRVQLGLRITRDPLEAFVQLQHSLLYNLPEHAPGPGGSYFSNTPDTSQDEVILRNAWLRWKNLLGAPGLGATLGRQPYRDGLETPARDATLAWLQKNRVAERLVGPFDYTQVGRSFDGGQLGWETGVANVTAFGFVPTWGGFEIEGNREIESIALAGLSATLRETESLPGSMARLFYLYYGDAREDVVFVDNRPLAERQADDRSARVHTLGAHVAHVHELGPGKADLLLWAAGQRGGWQRLDHRAWAYAVEAGYQLPGIFAAPWLRIGIDQSSGDGDPGDGRHETFFQMLPTARLYAQFPFYNLMNSEDVFAQLVLRPHRMATLRFDVHQLRVSERQDFLYAGGGATSSTSFGYSGTATGGHRDIGTLADVALTLQPTGQLTLYLYYGHVFGRGVIEQAFEGNHANYAYAEATLAF